VPTILNAIRLLSLPEEIKKALSDGDITEGHARAILSLQKFPKQQKELFKHIVAKKWSVRQAEQFAIAVKRGQQPSIGKPVKDVPDETATKLQKYLGAKKVTVQRSAKGSGKVVIFYKTEKELDKIVKKIYKVDLKKVL
jgi:ParB family chromosome partitioning protein